MSTPPAISATSPSPAAPGTPGTSATPGTSPTPKKLNEGNEGKRRAFVALGSNLGDRWAHLRTGLSHLPDVVNVSKVYETEPVGGPPGQGPYLNMVAELVTSLSPRELLEIAKQAERAAGRVRGERWGPRTLDVDILAVGDEQLSTGDLELPHPRMLERGFVLVPLADLAPELVAGHLTEDLRKGVTLVGSIWGDEW